MCSMLLVLCSLLLSYYISFTSLSLSLFLCSLLQFALSDKSQKKYHTFGCFLLSSKIRLQHGVLTNSHTYTQMYEYVCVSMVFRGKCWPAECIFRLFSRVNIHRHSEKLKWMRANEKMYNKNALLCCVAAQTLRCALSTLNCVALTSMRLNFNRRTRCLTCENVLR